MTGLITEDMCMYPNILFWDIDLYSIFMLLGVISSFVIFRICADKRRFTAKMQNLVLFDAIVSIIVGYLGAWVSQAFYNFLETGEFVLAKDSGVTFLGGLVVGVLVFFIIYFIAGRILFKNDEKEHITRLWELVSIGAGAIACAHALGRIGCFFAGCCYGVQTTSFLGIQFPGEHFKRLPVQLYESAFLFALFAAIMILNMKKDRWVMGMPIYLISYGIWRFLAEQFLRGDISERGGKILGLFPSQFISVFLVIGGIVLGVILYRKYYAKKKA